VSPLAIIIFFTSFSLLLAPLKKKKKKKGPTSAISGPARRPAFACVTGY